MKTHFPNPDDILNFKLTIDPDEGMYKGGRFEFDFKINQNFPHDPAQGQMHTEDLPPKYRSRGQRVLEYSQRRLENQC